MYLPLTGALLVRKMDRLILVVCFISGSAVHGADKVDKQAKVLIPSRKYSCVNGVCEGWSAGSKADGVPLYNRDGCQSICGRGGAIWPVPRNIKLGTSLSQFVIQDISTNFKVPDGKAGTRFKEFLNMASDIFKKNIALLIPEGKRKESSAEKITSNFQIELNITSVELDFNLKTDESYQLVINKRTKDFNVFISAPTYYGARHALETLSQMISYTGTANILQIVDQATIDDRPVYPYRGILIDTGRNYMSINSIRRTIDAMSMTKLNVLHWHMIESQSFPFVSTRVPEMTIHGAYAEDQVYYPRDIKALVVYGLVRGVRIVPEFDAPGHAGYGWQWGSAAGKGDMATCMTKEWRTNKTAMAAEPPSGQLNPTNKNMYDILEKIYMDMMDAFTAEFDLDMFHMGGDEVNFDCWETDSNIRQWLAERGFSTDPKKEEGYLDLWASFQVEALKRLVRAHKGVSFTDGVILWTSTLNTPANVDKFVDKKTYVIQIWTTGTDEWIKTLLEKGYRVIFSNTDAWYLDCGYGAWLGIPGKGPKNNWCSPYKGWQQVYDNSPRKMVTDFKLDVNQTAKLILGGEGAMWNEQNDEHTLDSKLWPRGAALGERLWSEPQTTWLQAEQRMLAMRRRMVGRGIQAERLQPEFCWLYPGWCYITVIEKKRGWRDYVLAVIGIAVLVMVWRKKKFLVRSVVSITGVGTSKKAAIH